jgi:hypothetical protein
MAASKTVIKYFEFVFMLESLNLEFKYGKSNETDVRSMYVTYTHACVRVKRLLPDGIQRK